MELIGSDEVFKEVEFNNNYLISNYGRVYSKERWVIAKNGMKHFTPGNMLKLNRSNHYPRVFMSGKYLTVHRLVAIHFLKDVSDKKHVNHIDGNKENNHYLNLEWVTQGENNIHAINSGLRNCLSMNDRKDIVWYAINNGRNHSTHKYLSSKYGVSETRIRQLTKEAENGHS